MIPFPIPPTTNNQIGSLGSFGDRTSSLQWLTLPPNIAIYFYENSDGSGARYAIAHDAARTGSVPNGDAANNDTFSSFSTHYEIPSQGLLRMWDGANYSGNSRRYALSSYAENTLHVLHGFGDTTSSFQLADLPANVAVWLYEHADGTGPRVLHHPRRPAHQPGAGAQLVRPRRVVVMAVAHRRPGARPCRAVRGHQLPGPAHDIDGTERSLFVRNHIDVGNPPIAWFSVTPKTQAALLGHALASTNQRPNFVQYDVHELGGDPGLDVCRLINQAMWTLRRASAARFHERCDRSSPTLSFDAIEWRGTGAWPVAVPDNQALLGVTLWLQSASSSSSWKLSNGLRAILGVR
jgi:hypothetical protein